MKSAACLFQVQIRMLFVYVYIYCFRIIRTVQFWQKDSPTKRDWHCGDGHQKEPQPGDVAVDSPENPGIEGCINLNLGLDHVLSEEQQLHSVHSAVGIHVPSNLKEKLLEGSM